MVRPIPYSRVMALALGAAVLLAFPLNLAVHDWAVALHMAVVIVFWVITLALAARALVAAIIAWWRRNRDDPGYQRDFDLAA